jgi:type I restriction enzyme S subunit
MAKLSSIAYYVTDKISSNDISLAEYVTTDCILQNKKGREVATNLPPQPCSLIRYQRDDVLIANIRPYLKKVWFADIDGGASPDVLVFRAKDGHSPSFLYAILLQDSFFDYVMQGTKGSKMPRGDKEQILRYEMPTFSCSEESIGTFFLNLDRKIHLNERINQNLEAMAKQLYNYWFVQFDFPNEEGKPYKSSGGKMVWNEKLKREIPFGWHCGNLFEIAVFTNGLACQKFRPKDDEASLPVIKIREMHDGISADTEKVTPNIPESVKVYNGDVLFSWSASLEVMLWAYGLGGLNQHIFKVTSANDFPKSFFYFQLLDYVDVFKKMAEARKTTMGHITQDHLQQSAIAIPNNKDIADRFEELISPIFNQIIKLHEEILNLTKQRDKLLPLLMNGQVSVNSDLSVCINLIIRTTTRICSYPNDLFWSYLRIVFL